MERIVYAWYLNGDRNNTHVKFYNSINDLCDDMSKKYNKTKGYHKNAKAEIFDIEKELFKCGEREFNILNLYNGDYVCEYILEPQYTNFINDGMEVLAEKINEPIWYSDLFAKI